MKIAYLMHWNEGPESGVFKKVAAQMAEWIALGHEVRLFLFTRRWKGEGHGGGEAVPADLPLVIQTYGKGPNRFAAFRMLLTRLEQWAPDAIYHRFDLYYAGLPRLLRRFPSILEINTNDLAEMRLGSRLRYLYHRLTRGLVLRSAGGFVFVSAEIGEEPHFKKYGQPREVIGNGFALSSATPSSPPSSVRVRLIFIGTPGQPWHGVDEIAALARLRPDWHFDMVGLQPGDMVGGSAPRNMEFHGRLSRLDYEPLLRQADVAVGSLALYRNRMNEASPLKVREYLAYGLPVIIGYKDTDFPKGVSFILELANEAGSTAKGLQDIENFVRTWKGRRVPASEVMHLDTAVKEAARVRFMERIVRKGGDKP